jgi:hypothetical protein
VGALTNMAAVFDTNILIEHLSGVPAAGVAFAGYNENLPPHEQPAENR